MHVDLLFVCIQPPQNGRSVNRHRYVFTVIVINVSLIILQERISRKEMAKI